MYKTEAEFSRAITIKLRACGFHVTKIETGMTSQGVPDLFVQGFGSDFWIELKNDNKLKLKNEMRISWRPAQVPWAYNYYLKHHKKKYTYTLVAADSCFYIIPMTELFTHNKVKKNCVMQFTCLTYVTGFFQDMAKGGDNATDI